MKLIIINFRLIIVLLYIVLIFNDRAFSQSIPMNVNWQNLDLETNGVFGASTERAYTELLHGKIGVPIIVAVIDGGVAINHEDLKNVIWVNLKEIPGNLKDDDSNGYIDDIRGWNFLGSGKGSFQQDNAEIVRLLRTAKKIKGNDVLELQKQLKAKQNKTESDFKKLVEQKRALFSILKNIGKENPTLSELKFYHYKNEEELNMLVYTVNIMKQTDDNFAEFKREFERRYLTYKNQLEYVLNIDYDPRKNNNEYNQKYYGNSDVNGIDPSHGTHCAGIIAAERDNGIGINGISNHTQIMVVRAIPEGDMLDKDLCSAIRYAVDNGARIINMSFNKQSSPEKEAVDEAVKYAMDNDVLIVHSAGNEGKEEKVESSFPSRYYKGGGEAAAWIEVGATGAKNDETLLAPFSNYGKTTTDVFAPGVKIVSTYPGNMYTAESGTSMSAPLVSGLAALIRSYYPKLNAIEVKNIILNSVKKVNHSVKNRFGMVLNFSDICLSGGVVNVFDALRLAKKMNKV